MMMEINAAALFRMVSYASVQLHAESEAINRLNVFPVPDGDTGSNMSMTMEGIDGHAEAAEDVAACAAAMGAGMLRCARGNSGVILSVFFRGFAKGLAGIVVATARDIVRAMQSGVEAAYGAVMNPTEGTILTVMRACAEAARHYYDGVGEDATLEDLFAAMVSEAHVALENTPELLPMLKKAGVVDAGGYGFEIILRAMQASLLGQEGDFTPISYARPAAQSVPMSADFNAFKAYLLDSAE